MDQKFCTTIMSADPRKSLRPRESHPGGIPDDPGLSRIKTFDRHQRPRWSGCWVRAAADLAALAALRTAAGVDPDGAAPEPLPVYLGGGPGASGVFLGAWAVTRLAETERTLRADGAPTRVDFTVTLQEAAP